MAAPASAATVPQGARGGAAGTEPEVRRFTQLRGEFVLAQPKNAISSALAHASGVGCFTMSVNGRAADVAERNRSFMDPGWANIPTARMLYRQYDVRALIRDGTNVVGARLGQCKYGYQGSFCAGAHGSLAKCRAFRLHMLIAFGQPSMEHGSSTEPRFARGQ